MEYTKYPRTMNFPWSNSTSSDDVWWEDSSALDGKEVVMTEKIDGECTTIYPDGHVHARSIDTNHHASRSWVKSLAAGISYRMPKGLRICGENVFAWHSIFYADLSNYFFVYGMYDENNRCLSWSDTETWCAELALHTVPVIWRGIWDEDHVKSLWQGEGAFPTFASKIDPADGQPTYPKDFEPCDAEGYVVRPTNSFPYDQFKERCAKFVRPNHVQTASNWMTRSVIRNLLKSD